MKLVFPSRMKRGLSFVLPSGDFEQEVAEITEGGHDTRVSQAFMGKRRLRATGLQYECAIATCGRT